jgi:hypothetical protein
MFSLLYGIFYYFIHNFKFNGLIVLEGELYVQGLNNYNYGKIL